MFKIASSEKELIGKEIALIHFPRFGNNMMIATTDKTILIYERVAIDDDDEPETDVYNSRRCWQEILDNNYTKEELIKAGIITRSEIHEYINQLEKVYEENRANREKEAKEQEYKQYLNLKNKYDK